MPIYLSYGKQKYTIADLPDVEWAYSYSAKEFEKELNDLFAGQTLKAIYVDLDGYLEALSSCKDCIDMSYMGGTALVVFEKTVLQLAIHVEGMIEYRHFPIWEMRLRRVFDYAPDDMVMADRYFFNAIDHDVSYDYTDKETKNISVKGTDTWAFPQPNFDEEKADKAAEGNNLPAEIAIYTESCVVRFLGSDLEYYLVYFEAPDAH